MAVNSREKCCKWNDYLSALQIPHEQVFVMANDEAEEKKVLMIKEKRKSKKCRRTGKKFSCNIAKVGLFAGGGGRHSKDTNKTFHSCFTSFSGSVS